MRNENQVKRKMNELQLQKQSLESRLADLRQSSPEDGAAVQSLVAQAERLEDMILLLEWVLNEPMGSYHA